MGQGSPFCFHQQNINKCFFIVFFFFSVMVLRENISRVTCIECFGVCSFAFPRLHAAYLPLTCFSSSRGFSEQLAARVYLCACRARVCTRVFLSYTGDSKVNVSFVAALGISQGEGAGKWQLRCCRYAWPSCVKLRASLPQECEAAEQAAHPQDFSLLGTAPESIPSNPHPYLTCSSSF